MFVYKNSFGKKFEFHGIHQMSRDVVNDAVNLHAMAIFKLSRHDEDGEKTWFFFGCLPTIKFLAKEWNAKVERVKMR